MTRGSVTATALPEAFGPCPSRGAPKRTKLRLFSPFLLVFWFLVAGLGYPGSGMSQEAPEPRASDDHAGPVDFDTCVQLALRQSPALLKSALEIEVRRLDEADSKSDFFPTFKIRTRYYVSMPKEAWRHDTQVYSLSFTSDDYNPLLAYFSLKVKKLITQIAVLGHMKVIAASLQRLGQGFLELEATERLAALHRELLAQSRENLSYVRERRKLGEVSPLEVQVAEQELEVLAAEQEQLAATREKLREAIRHFLDLKPGQPLEFDLKQARRQVLGDFDPSQASREDAENRAFDLRIQKLVQELQAWNITLAKMRFLPNFNMAVQTADPLSLTDVRGYFFSLGLNFTVFDGFKRMRDINRQKTILKQVGQEVSLKEKDLLQAWREAQEKVRTAAAALRTARAQEELARLKERQGEILYRAGEPLSVVLAARQGRVKAQIQVVQKSLEYDLAALGVRHLTGDLVYRFVNERQFRQEP